MNINNKKWIVKIYGETLWQWHCQNLEIFEMGKKLVYILAKFVKTLPAGHNSITLGFMIIFVSP